VTQDVLYQVARVLESHPNVVRARVLPVPAHDYGTELRAFAVLHGDRGAGAGEQSIDGTGLRAWLIQRLDPASVPHAVLLRRCLPLGATGKVGPRGEARNRKMW
jgi:acyl-CoA synthetase (AMP-forming)/AMP-acid ligase II